MAAEFLHIVRFTLADHLRRKSSYLLLGVGLLFLFLLRTCFGGNVVVNNQAVDQVTVAWHVARIAFHLVSVGGALFAVLLTMRLFSRDRAEGDMVMILSRPVSRQAYLLGRLLGTAGYVAFFQFILHLALLGLAWLQIKAVIGGYLTASLLVLPSIALMVTLTALLTLLLPDVIAALFALIVTGVGFGIDTWYAMTQSRAMQEIAANIQLPDPAWWQIVWVKTTALQYAAAAQIKNEAVSVMGGVPPLANVAAWTVLLLAASLVIFNKKEI